MDQDRPRAPEVLDTAIAASARTVTDTAPDASGPLPFQ
jgi:hypothetical protein